MPSALRKSKEGGYPVTLIVYFRHCTAAVEMTKWYQKLCCIFLIEIFEKMPLYIQSFGFFCIELSGKILMQGILKKVVLINVYLFN